MSREKILAAVKANQFDHAKLPDLEILNTLMDSESTLIQQYTTIASAGGSFVYEVTNFEAIKTILHKEFKQGVKIISGIKELDDYIFAGNVADELAHSFADVEL